MTQTTPLQMNNNELQLSERQHIRKTMRMRRQSFPLEQQQIASSALLTQLIEHKEVQQAQHIAMYLANDGELDPQLFIQWCWQNNKAVYLPVIHPFAKGQLLFIRYEQHSIMIKNKYNILEPKLNCLDVIPTHQLDVIFTPLVAFDNSGSRIGMGGGFYDRTLSAWYQQSKTPDKADNPNKLTYTPIGLAHDFQCISQIPILYWDIPLPEIITPTNHYKF